MKKVSKAYKLAMAKKIRNHAYMAVSVGIISNKAQASASVTSSTSYLSNKKFIFRARKIANEYATFEENQAFADGTQLFPPEDGSIVQLAEDVAVISDGLNGSIKVTFDNRYDLKGLTLDFGRSYPTEFEININGDRTYTYQNDSEMFVSTDVYSGAYEITITPLHFVNGDNKRLRIGTMLMGVGVIFQNDAIESASLSDESSFVSETLPQLDFTITCFDREKRFNVDDEQSYINYLQAGQTISTSIGIELDNGKVEWLYMPLMYLTSWSCDTQRISFTGADRFTLFDIKYTEGDYIHTRTLGDDALAIFNFLGLEPDEYFIDDFLFGVEVENPLPQTSCANLLQLIANAGRCALKQDDDGMICIIPNFENIIEPLDIGVETDSESYWSDPTQVRSGSSIVYADFTRNFASADGTMLFIPPEGESLLESGFVSQIIADDNGDFSTNPTLTMTLPASYTYYGIDFEFAGNPPTEFILRTYDEGVLIDEITATDITNEYYINYPLRSFDEIEFEFTKGTPRNRVVIQRVSLGSLTDYRLLKQDMMANPIGSIEPKTQSVSVKVFSFTEETKDGVTKTKVVDDDVYYTQVLGTVGEAVTYENQLISTMEHAEEVAEWLANYYANNITYEVNYRGEPRIESLDYIYMDSDILNNLQVEVEKHVLNFNGALSGTLNLRRAVNMINTS